MAGFQVITEARRLPSSFLPDEDQGYLYVNMQFPNSASIERTAAAAEQVEKILADTPGVQYNKCDWFQPSELRAHQLQRFLLRDIEALG
jgi:AcrB/AcrD/AcrF family protein